MVARGSRNGLTSVRHIPWFNPREMDDDTVLALSTGRESLLAELLSSIEERVEFPGQFKHWLITGPRGAGKSFFLRLLQTSFSSRLGMRARFVLLPEEFPNIYSPHELLQEIQRLLDPTHYLSGDAARWRVEDTASLWNEALKKLLSSVSEPLLVVGIENFDVLITQAFSNDVDNSRLRHLMSNESRIMFVATAVQGGFDENYNQRLFRQFEQRSLTRWSADDHRAYLFNRAQQQNRTPSPQQLNRIDAYSRYTGGSPRAAAILAATILDMDDPLLGASDLDTAIEKMSDYYRALLERIPANTRKLFDALVRGGEPASQTELAERTGAKQNEISRPFMWLLDNAYVSEHREPGQKTKHYRVLDRLLVQFYRMRYLHPGQRSRLAIMTDLLADTLSFRDKWQFANRYVNIGQESEALSMVELALKERQIDIKLLPAEWCSANRLIGERVFWEKHEVLNKYFGKQDSYALIMCSVIEEYASDALLKSAIDNAAALARASVCEEIRGDELVTLIKESLSMCPVEKYTAYSFMIGPERNPIKWRELKKSLEIESQEFKQQEIVENSRISKLHQFKEFAIELPLTASLHKLSYDRVTGDILNFIPMYSVVSWSTKAIVGWQKAKQHELLNEALQTFFIACDESLKNEYKPQIILASIEEIEPLKINLMINQELKFFEIHGNVLTLLNQSNSAYLAFKAARELWLSWKDDVISRNPGAAVNTLGSKYLDRMAWSLGMDGNIKQAIKLHRQAMSEKLSDKNIIGDAWDIMGTAWNLGQIARYICSEKGFALAWQELDDNFKFIPEHEVEAITQLADAIYDRYSHDGEAQAFALGIEIFQGVAQRAIYPVEAILRGMILDMIEMNIPFTLLRDLLDEWPEIWPTQEYPGIQLLRKLLLDWFDDLQQSPSERETKRKTLDPDLATTLIELEKALPPHTRHRLGLL